MRLSLEHLRADLFGLGPDEREALAADPELERLPGVLVPRRLESLPRPPDPLDSDDRAALVATWESRLTALEPHVAVLDTVRTLGTPNTFAVLAEAPPHFCGGPLEVVFRALHAVRLARSLTATWDRPVVPIFWNDADEHDLGRVRDLVLVNERLDLRGVAPAGLGTNRLPVSRLPLNADRHRLPAIEQFLRQELAGHPFLDEALEASLPRLGETLAGAFTRFLTTVLGPLGLAVLEPDWVREDLSRSLAGLVALDPARELGSSASEGPALVHRVDDTGRRPLRPGGDGFRYDDEAGSRTPSELAAEVVQDPERWSAGELLLPPAQESLLPLAARVGTWNEWRRLVTLAAFRRRAGLPPVPFVPALQATLVDPDCARALERIGESPAELLARPGESDRATPGAPTSSEVARRIRAAANRAAGELRGLRGELAELDRGLAVQLKRTAGELEELAERLAKRVDRSHANRDGKRGRHGRRLRNTLHPRGRPQAEVLGSLPFLARHGREWLPDLIEELEPLPVEHLIIHLNGT